MASTTWSRELAETYDASLPEMFAPAVLGPTVDRLAELAGSGPVLELAIGTGRVALPLQGRGLAVHGIELSPHMVAQLRAKPGGDQIAVAVGDMAATRVPGRFSLVYLVFNTITNVTTQAEQVAVVANAAAHLEPGGRFVVEVNVPSPPTDGAPHQRVFDLRPEHVGIDTYDDPVGQVMWSHHWTMVDGRLVVDAAPYRYVWPSELDLMARLAGLALCHRWAGWDREPFTATSTRQVAVYEKDAPATSP